MKRLAAMQLWPLLIRRASAAVLRRLLNVGVFQDDERIAAAELEHRLLELVSRLLGHFAAGALAAGERDRANARIGDDRGNFVRANQERAKEIFRKSRVAEDFLDFERAARHVGSMFQDSRVPRHQRRGGEAEDLPKRKVPRHDGQYGTYRIESHVAARRFGLARLVGQESFAVLSIVVTGPGALLHFRFTLDDRFPHL